MKAKEYLDMMKTVAGPKRSKYNATKTAVNGRVFDSKLEAGYYIKLLAECADGSVAGVVCQPAFDLGSGITYRADFLILGSDGKYTIVDCKGMDTQTWKLKMKMFFTKYPKLELQIVRKSGIEILRGELHAT